MLRLIFFFLTETLDQTWGRMPVIQALWRPRQVDHLRWGVQDQPDQHDETQQMGLALLPGLVVNSWPQTILPPQPLKVLG